MVREFHFNNVCSLNRDLVEKVVNFISMYLGETVQKSLF